MLSPRLWVVGQFEKMEVVRNPKATPTLTLPRKGRGDLVKLTHYSALTFGGLFPIMPV